MSKRSGSIRATTPDKKKFAVKEYSEAAYTEELERLHEAFTPIVLRCKEYGRAMRIGTNHGSLSDRIMNRYGDTPLGMVESALEFIRIAESHRLPGHLSLHEGEQSEGHDRGLPPRSGAHE
jgi:4-hydroxy-3-methylbut-2-en-1-yl diphosphate synthase IspG/GcpE